jgi:Ran GTPase-activating protein (RanGAP) involved in mRNA processing and transport
MKKVEKLKNWEELVNDGEQYGDPTSELTQDQKAVFENIKDQKILKIQDAYAFIKRDEVTRSHGINLATLVSDFEPLSSVHTIIITHNNLGPEGVKIIAASSSLPKVDYLHLGSNNIGDEGLETLASCELFSEVKTLNLEQNGITERGAKALATSSAFTQLTSLNLVDNRIGDQGALAIANSDTLSNLIYLHLGGNQIKSEAAKGALRESKNLTQLKTLKVF